MGFERRQQARDSAIDNSRNRIEHPVLQRMHAEAKRILAEDAIDPARFTDLYGTENVTRDLRKVEEIKSKFESNESKSAAEVFEAILHQHVELSDWLGPNAETIRASEFDDIINGVDLIVEFNEDDSTRHLALGVDVTFGSISMQKKFERIKTEIEANKLATVKYFEAHGYQGSLTQTPRVVVGVELDKVIQLAGLWERGDNKTLGGHVAKEIIADSIERQLRTFLLYAQSIHAEDAVKSYSRAYNTVRQMHTARNGFSQDKAKMQMVQSDRVYQTIIENLKRFQPSSRGR
jgi:hypothetical protein